MMILCSQLIKQFDYFNFSNVSLIKIDVEHMEIAHIMETRCLILFLQNYLIL